jgi:hypothetical protein
MAFCLGVAYVMASPSTVVIKGAMMAWDEVARVALQTAGKSCTDDAVKGAVKTLTTATEQHGDEIVEAAMRGGIEVAEASLVQGRPFVDLLRRNSRTLSPAALRQAALHAHEMVRLSAQYGDDVIRLNEKLPGQTARLLGAIERSGVTKASAVQMANTLPAHELARVTRCLEVAKDAPTSRAFLEAVQRGGSKFIDKLFTLNARQIMAGGVTMSMVVVAEHLTAPQKVVGENAERAMRVAMDILKDPNATAAQREAAQGILDAHHELHAASLLSLNQLAWGALALLAIWGSFFCWRKRRSKR